MTFLVVGCVIERSAPPSGRVLGILADGTSEPPATVEVAVSHANSTGGIAGSPLRLEVEDASAHDSVTSAYMALANRRDVWAVLSVLPPEKNVELATIEEESRVATISGAGFTFWAIHDQPREASWHLGLESSFVGSASAFFSKIESLELTCSTYSALLASGDRTPDILMLRQVAEGASINWVEPVVVSQDDVSWPVTPDCALIELGAIEAFAMLPAEGRPTPIFVELRDARPFESIPEQIGLTDNALVINHFNGAMDLRNWRALEEDLLKHNESNPRLRWESARQFDAAMIATLGIATSSFREEVLERMLRAATNDVPSRPEAPEDTPIPAWELPVTFSQALVNTKGDLSVDYRGVTGAIDFPGGQPIPVQRYEISTIVNLLEDNLTRIARVSFNETSPEYMITP